jgi:hypothetical protein
MLSTLERRLGGYGGKYFKFGAFRSAILQKNPFFLGFQ